MKIYSKIACFIALLFCTIEVDAQFASTSVMSSGQWHELEISSTGVYKITYGMLSEIGLSPESIDPKQLKIYGFGGQELPQANSAQRFSDIPENAIWVAGQADGRFDTEDYILFYAVAPKGIIIDQQNRQLQHAINPYTDKSHYYLCLSAGEGKRLSKAISPATSTASFDYFDDLLYIEPEEINVLYSGREWFSSPYGITTTKEFPFSVEGLVAGAQGKATLKAMGRSEDGCAFGLALNSTTIGELSLPGIFISRYGLWGSVREQTFDFTLPSGTSEIIATTTFQKRKNGDLGYLDYMRLQVPRKLQRYGTQTSFRVLASGAVNSASFNIANMSASSMVWEVSQAQQVISHDFELNGSTATFSANTNGQIPTFVAFEPQNLPLPTWTGSIANQNLHELEASNLLIVTVQALQSEALRLASFREQQDGLTTQVVLLSDIYKEFSSGRADITAIRDFIRMLYLRSEQGGGKELRYVLLFGDASYDYKGYSSAENTNIIPTYQSYNSTDPLNTYSSDDYFAFMSEEEGAWEETGSSTSTHTMDIGVGRLPAQNIAEAKLFVDKLIHYQSSPLCLGNWRQRLAFAADDGDLATHQRDADSLANTVERLQASYHTQRIFVDAYEQVNQGNGKRSPAAKAALVKSIEDGALVVNFTGHGSETGWTSEGIMDNPTAQRLQNYNQLPLFVTATCEFGRYDDPVRDSGAEVLLKNEEGGAIGLLTTTRPVFSFSNFRVNRAFYNALFEPINSEMPRLGDILRLTKNNSISGVNNRNFALLGDPSMRLAYPQNQVALTQINGATANTGDTLKALLPVNIKGEVREGGLLDTGFNGELEVVVYDRPAQLQTFGDDEENIKMPYQEFKHVLYRGKTRVSNGLFSFDFVVPKDIAYDYGWGKIQLYAQSNTEVKDAQGHLNVRIGGTATVPADDAPPMIEGWLGDMSFQPNGEVSRQPLIIVHANDANGLNISGKGIGHDLQATIDNEAQYTYILNDYLEFEEGSFQEGWAYFQMPDQLSPGKHELHLQVFDTHNNPAEVVIPFVVKQAITLDFKQNWPNPFSSSTTFSFSHDRTGDDLSVTINIYNMQGGLAATLQRNIFKSEGEIDLFWNGKDGIKQPLQEGFYIAELQLQSLIDGETIRAKRKMVVVR